MWHKTPTQLTYLWYDYETWGTSPARDRIAQFAAQRTDLNLNPIGEPINLMCRPPEATVIDPESVVITGLSPLELDAVGLNEFEFAKAIHKHMSEPGTCSVGYNTIRFDDECTRYLFYRNLLDPYAREWKNSNSRWDLLDVVRMTKALRPEGIEWPTHDDGSPSFKLEHLTAANGLSHANAHDAVSDVLATIDLARLIKSKQPKLFDYAFQLRSKHEVRSKLDFETRSLHLHITGKIPASENCLGIELPLLMHPDRNNEAIMIDVREDPSWVLDHDVDTLKTWLYKRTDDMTGSERRPPFKTIHLNRSPMIAPFKMLDDDTAERLELDRDLLIKHQAIVDQNPEFTRLALAVFTDDRTLEPPEDPEHALYSGFIDDHDRALLNKFVAKKIPMDAWLNEAHALRDDRLTPLIRNLLGRHYPDYLLPADFRDYEEYCRLSLTEPNVGQTLTIDEALAKITTFLEQQPDNKALQDTETYLLTLKNNPRFMKSTNSASIPDANVLNSLGDSVSENADPKSKNDSETEISNQLDLF